MAGWKEDDFGVTEQGSPVKRFTCQNSKGLEVSVISLGATVTAIKVPGADGSLVDVVAGYDNVKDYESNVVYFGTTVGRVANRIAKGRFQIGDQHYQLAINNEPNHLHGGPNGFHKQIWSASVEGEVLSLTYVSADGEENYPGQVTAHVTYRVTADNALEWVISASTDKATPVNMTNHSYFNLAGHTAPNVYDHTIEIMADHFTPKDGTHIPTGEIASVSGTVFDLRTSKLIGDHVNNVPNDLGYDHNFCVRSSGDKALAARVKHEGSGRVLEVYTNQPGVQFYTANYVDNLCGKEGAVYGKHSSLCLETQIYPDAVNQPNFPKVILQPGEKYENRTSFKFL